jgi:hypothetical protein
MNTKPTWYITTAEGRWIGNVTYSESAAIKFCRRFSGGPLGQLSYTTVKPSRGRP